MWWLLPAASAATGFFEPAPVNKTLVLEVSGQTYRWGDIWLSGAHAFMRARAERWLLGGELRLLDDPHNDDHWDVHAATMTFGYAVIDEGRADVVPYVRVGTHLQVGLTARVAFRTPAGRLVFDGSGGPVQRLPNTWTSPPVPGIDAEPGAPELGAALHFRTPYRPGVRVGLLGDQIALTGQISGKRNRELSARVGVTWRPEEPINMGFFGAGVRI